jgi:hypothetical protein
LKAATCARFDATHVVFQINVFTEEYGEATIKSLFVNGQLSANPAPSGGGSL